MSNQAVPRKAMVLAAGLGTRMRPITDRMPKPLVPVAGRALIDWGLDSLAAAGVEEAVVNVHHHADQMIAHLDGRKSPRIVISDERAQLLDSAGAIVKALPEIGKDPFFILNADTFWIEGPTPNLARLAAQWDPARMDILLMIAVTSQAVGYSGRGDFVMDKEGMLARVPERTVSPYVYAGVAIADPRLFEGETVRPVSLNRFFDRAIAEGRLYGMRMDGLWLTVGTPEAIGEAEQAIAEAR